MNTLSSDLCSRLLNREQGILRFNERVLAMADDATVPLLERLRDRLVVAPGAGDVGAKLSQDSRVATQLHVDHEQRCEVGARQMRSNRHG